MRTLNTIPLFSLVCILTALAQATNTSLTHSHARRSLERAHHQRRPHHAPKRLDTPDVDKERRRTMKDRGVVDDLLSSLPPTSTASSTSSISTTDSASTASSTDSASSTITATDSASSSAATDSASSASATDSASSSATATDSATSSPAVTDSATSSASVSDSSTATVSDPSPTPTVSDPSPTPTVSDPPASPTVSDPPSTSDSPTPTVSDPPASTASCDPLDLVCRASTILFPSDSPTSDIPVSTPAPTSDVPQTTDIPQTSDTPQTSDPPQTSDVVQTDSSTPTPTPTDTPVSTSDAPASTSNIISDILSSLFPTSTSDKPDPTDSSTPTQSGTPTDSSTPTQSDKPTDTATQSDQPTQTDTGSVSQTISQPPPTNTATQTDSFSDSYINTKTITASDSPTDSATDSATRTESVSFPTLTSSPTDSEPTATDSNSIASESVTDSEASVTMTTQPIPSEYSYITDSSLALTMQATSTQALTLTDPDAAPTTASLTQSGTAAPSQAVAFPTQLPTRIFPANRLDPDDPALTGMTLVSLKFRSGLTWSFVVNNSNTAALLFVYTPETIANALGIPADQVKTFAMQAFAPADYNGDISQLSTVYLMYIPIEQVDALQQQLLTQNSPLYVNQAGIPKQISQQLDSTFPVNAVGLDTTIVGTGNTGSGNNSGSADASAASRRDAIIGVCAAFGVILLAVVFWWGYKSWKRRQDKAHRRLTHDSAGMHQAGGYGATTQTAYGGVYGPYGAAPPRSGYPQPHTPVYTTAGAPIANPFEDSSYEEDPDERRRSFFYAEDSLRGFSVPREEDQGITYTQMRQQQGLMPNDGKRRAPIQASAISAPILRESSLNW